MASSGESCLFPYLYLSLVCGVEVQVVFAYASILKQIVHGERLSFLLLKQKLTNLQAHSFGLFYCSKF